ncbi:dTDP-4-dehydrorhamnose reductase [Paenibacillus alkaliterrae]|uniref:dTDP-4-dehydrorhamnose reductase n=1 Tax=Paenibacillus alkaliterrae TaxID=320909 RepID=UPI001F2951C0|nr:dTDP-4-dehydrorhamnose reductase [Paenibacillus alkaliterrae]MCF2940379.1 dTDP-4-dehydrorhamnose reductase [Paenibacillus alkaliterrae]
MKVLITGAGGQLGYDLMRVLSPLHDVTPLTRQQLDVTDEKQVEELLTDLQPDVVIHAAAYTNVDRAESEVELAYQVNAYGSWYVAKVSEQIGAKLVYVSTDYVFDGTKGTPYAEDDKTNPCNVYGNSKLLGEKFVVKSCPRSFIVRTSWLYGTKGANFVTKVIDKAKSQGQLTMVNDQFGSPTYCLDLASFIGELITTEKFGIYHASNQGSCSRYEFALEIMKCLQMDHVQVFPVSDVYFPLPATRPQYSAFEHKSIRIHGITPLRDWKSALKSFLYDDYHS